MLRKVGIYVAALALGLGAAAGAAACGEERGDVQIEGGTDTAGKTEKTETAP